MSVAYDAFVVRDTVYVLAVGENNTSGWKNYFQKSLLTIYPPDYTFNQEPPHGIALEVITPFVAETWFPYDTTSKPSSIKITDAHGTHVVKIRTSISVAERGFTERAITARLLLPGSNRLVGLSKAKGMQTYYERSLGSYDDLLSQHCSTECVKIEEIDHTGIKVCTEYRTVCQHIRVHAVLIVQVGTAQDIATAVETALQKAAIASAIAAFLAAFASGGSAAAGAFKATFVSVLTSEIAQSLSNLIRVDVDYRTEWV